MALKDEELTAEQIESFRRMTPDEILDVLDGLYRTAWSIKTARVKMLHPDWSDEEVRQEVARIFLHAHT